MNAVKLEHPPGEVLIAYGLGQLKEEELAGIDGHLANCAVCRQVVEGAAPDTLVNLLCSAATEPHSSEWVAAAESGGEAAGLAASGVTSPPVPAPTALMNHPRYRVGELLGIGGMGAVYKAEHLLMKRPVALKVLNHELIDKPATIERFRREVRAAARLTHPNIVAAFDAEQAGEVHFLVMEYVEGVSLARRIAEDGPLPIGQACDYVRQTALGLQHAHECGMVHRDIKPQNLMLTPNGQVKILDFGLARFVLESVSQGVTGQRSGVEKGAAPASAAGEVKSLTHSGIVMGTPD
jgi:eukaryotic-like serine/threonine-protein kinase